MTGVSGTLFGSKTMVYNDDNRLTSMTYGGVTDLYYYTYTGLRYRARLGGTYYRYLYHGERVLEQLTNTGTMQARYTTEDGSYYGQLLHLYRPSGTASRFPLYDAVGSARMLVDASGTVTDTYELDTFGRAVSSTGSTPNPYRGVYPERSRRGRAWGYITDPSGMLQLGARYYWPEIGRFISQDPIGEGGNWYAYASNSPVSFVDPTGTMSIFPLGLEKALADAEKRLRKAKECAEKTRDSLNKKYQGQGLSDKLRHCIYACEIQKKCGSLSAWGASIGKELQDAKPFDDAQCEWGDLVADKKGIGHGKAGSDCEKACNKDYPPPCPSGGGGAG